MPIITHIASLELDSTDGFTYTVELEQELDITVVEGDPNTWDSDWDYYGYIEVNDVLSSTWWVEGDITPYSEIKELFTDKELYLLYDKVSEEACAAAEKWEPEYDGY